MTLKRRWTTAVLLPFLFALIEDIIAVTQVPMFYPRTIGIAVPKEIAPVTDNACKIPIDAEDD